MGTRSAYYLKRYRTKYGFLVKKHSYLRRLVRGGTGTASKPYLFIGLDLVDKQTFIEWSLSDEDFNFLFDNWVKLIYDTKITPTIGRYDTRFGFELWNLQWTTKQQNSQRAAYKRWHNIIL